MGPLVAMQRVALTCPGCGMGQRGDRGEELARALREHASDPTQHELARQRDLELGREHDGQTFIEVPVGTDLTSVRCPNVACKPKAPSEVELLRSEVAELR